MKHEKHVGKFVRQNSKGPLGVFSQKIALLDSLTALLKKNLPSPLQKHCQVANLRDNCLIIMTDSAAWATQIRFLTPDLLKCLKQTPELYNLRTLEFYVDPAIDNTPPEIFIKREPLSANNIQLLQRVGNMRDDELGKALRKMAEHALLNTPKGK
ncbi:MAG: DUF721 domain-containing protein [Gammaproteobacteria bacterium]